ncbi:MAG TPA: dihydrolipoyl dehydrogenase [Anaerohalosphaeraceae bacterium]|jgi:dihydrolipoamide dehydrogenase|nr:dihydrolipoyl dehydrogenase [Anaerohalosphaeraceae bacterium]HRT50351.1 dihydrolipoyl dehydrogenase [Anaerohalosphaeraceae bacterium]HRT86282.1 dihydrolipoyl dehydrogenase [Anaerohalosphaeraceae bacterium]
MAHKVQVAIIGAGSAGLSALRRVKERTDDYVMVDPGPLGTKCARVGCMPSKALICVANDFHRRHVFERQGIRGGDRLRADISAVMRHVRVLRDRFAGAMAETTRRLAGDRLVMAHATLLGPNRIRAGQQEIEADRIIIATGSRPRVPENWRSLGDCILTSDTIFEQPDLPRRIAVIGLGPVGLELGQALSRLGLEIVAFSVRPNIAAIADEQVNESALQAFSEEFPVHTGFAVDLQQDSGGLLVRHPAMSTPVDAALVAVGAAPNLDGLGIENLGVPLDERGLPPYDPRTAQIADLPVYIAGDATGCRPILHEALDEGFIAGYNGSTQETHCFGRRTRLPLVFSDPQIAKVGMDRRQMVQRQVEFVTGGADFADQSRAELELHNRGLLHIYADRESARLLGAEMVCPDAEHLGHLLALAMQNHMTVFDLLQMPFYHPTAEEALRTALRDAAQQLSPEIVPELSLCGSAPEPPLC